MKDHIFLFEVASLMKAPEGANERYTFEGDAEFEDLELKSKVKGKVEIMKIEDGFNVRVEDFETKIGFQCDRCLKPISKKITVPVAERVFWIEKPEEVDDEFDLYLVDKKHSRVDITEMLRQEIILHFPSNSVCSSGCRGGFKNEAENADTKSKPLAALKDLFKKQ